MAIMARRGSLPFPGYCSLCTYSERDCVDLSIDYKEPAWAVGKIGAILICTECFKDVAKTAGYVHNDVMFNGMKQTEERVRSEYTGVESYKVTLDKVRVINDDISRVLADLDNGNVVANPEYNTNTYYALVEDPEQIAIEFGTESGQSDSTATSGQGDNTSSSEELDGIPGDSGSKSDTELELERFELADLPEI